MLFALTAVFAGKSIRFSLLNPNPNRFITMATPPPSVQKAEENMKCFKGENHSAFVVGFTGATGSALVRDLDKFKIFKRVVLIGRRQVALDVGPEFELKVIDFTKLEEHADVFNNLDVGFCCLGPVGRGRAYENERELVTNIARVSKSRGCQQFSLVSAVGANSSSRITAIRTKGEAIDAIKDMDFTRASIYKPGNLLAKRDDFRLYEAVVNRVLKPIYYCFPTSLSIPVETLARAMVNHVVEPLPSTPQTNCYDNKECHLHAGLGRR